MRKVFCFLVYMVFVSTMAEAQVVSSCPDDNHPHMIDLGLDDGTLWACCNVGATSPEKSGDYFAWGETTPKNNYDWNSYKWCEGLKNSITKYNYDDKYGIVDNKLELDLEDDAAYINWGGNWHMPDLHQIEVLRWGTTTERTVVNGVNGVVLKSKKNNNCLFFPDTGGMFSSNCNMDNGGLWTRTLDGLFDVEPYAAAKSPVLDDMKTMCYYERSDGFCIRPVAMIPSSSGIALNTMNFPDANFRKALAERYHILDDGTGEITSENIASTTMLNISNKAIENLSGIEFFPSLRYLYCDHNQLSSLDISKNINLYYIDCSYNHLYEINCPEQEITNPASSIHFYFIQSNRIKEPAMDGIINNLPGYMIYFGGLWVVDSQCEEEENECTTSQVAIANRKGYDVYDYNGGERKKYEGYDPSSIKSFRGDARGIETYYMLDGRKLNGKPIYKGVFIKNGHKIVVK